MKHIMLLFLSEVHLNDDRTLSVSRYHHLDGTMIYCVQTNESAVRRTADLLKKQGERLDCLFYFSTKRTQEEIRYIDETGDERTLTHEALFLERIQSFAAHCVRIDYDERSQTEESIRQVLTMADTIRTFMESQSWLPEEVALHADFTGGFRHASMIMLSVMQLLKYRGIRTMSVLYSNRNEQQVENVTDIYRMFNLISGADEFINFGSTREITAYMEGSEQTRETKRLLQTMRDFTNAVRICRTGKITPLAKKLQEALRDFEQAGAVSLQEKIFLRILEVFKSEYGSLLQDDFTNFDIIRWCVEKGYLQQAMTLCSEWIPGEIVSRRIFYPVNDSIITKCTKQKMNYQTWQQYFLNALMVEHWQEKLEKPLNKGSEASVKEDDSLPLQENHKPSLKGDGKVPLNRNRDMALKKDLEFPRKECRRLTFKGYRVISLKQYWQERLRPVDWERQETRLRTMVRIFECSGNFSSVSKLFKDDADFVRPLLEELPFGARALSDLKKGRLTAEQLKETWPRIHMTLLTMYEKAKETPAFNQTAEEYFKTLQMGDVYDFLKMASYDLFQTLLKLNEPLEEDQPSEENQSGEISGDNTVSKADVLAEASENDGASEENPSCEISEKEENHSDEAEETVADESLEGEAVSEEDVFDISDLEYKWNIRKANYLQMMSNDDVAYKRPAEATMEILYNYFQIRNERNNINHANDEDSLSTEAIKDLVLDLLRRMEDIDGLKS